MVHLGSIKILAMHYHLFFIVIVILVGCSNGTCKKNDPQLPKAQKLIIATDTLSYNEIKANIEAARLAYRKKYPTPGDLESDSAIVEISRFWVSKISGDLFQQWKGTPWDFNGTTTVPREGSIACGYFVTTLLSHMGVQLNRRQLSTCASSEMMRKLVPGRPLINLSELSYSGFCDSIRKSDPGVFIIGLDYHTGIIVVDSSSAWFIHSYYAPNVGIIKEVIELSPALQSSKTKWIMPLTYDKGFIRRWIHH